jgi:hypothetical protein
MRKKVQSEKSVLGRLRENEKKRGKEKGED